MTFIYEYQDSIRECEKILEYNFTKLYNYVQHRGPSVSTYTKTDHEFANLKTYFDQVNKNIKTLKKEYHALTEHYLVLFESNFAGEFLNYVECQEPLRLKLIETVFECKSLQSCLDNIYRNTIIGALEQNSSNTGDESEGSTSQSKSDVYEDSSQNEDNVETYYIDEVEETEVEEKVTVSSVAARACTNATSSQLKHGVHQSIVCNLCGKNFSCRANLRRHKSNIHEGVKPFVCNVCDKAFFRKDKMKKHILAVHESYRFTCSFCNESFLRKSSKQHHERVAHAKFCS